METKQLNKVNAHKAFRFLATVLTISGLFSFALADGENGGNNTAGGGGTVSVPSTVDAAAMLGSFISFVLNIVTLAGVGVLIWGIVQFAMSMPAHDPQQRTNSYFMIGAGAVIISARAILAMFGVSIT